MPRIGARLRSQASENCFIAHLHDAARIAARAEQTQLVARATPVEKRDAGAEQHRHDGDHMLGDQPLGAERRGELAAADEPGAPQAASLHLGSHGCRRVAIGARKHPVRLAGVGPLGKLQALLVGRPTEEYRFHGSVEIAIAIVLARPFEWFQPVDAAIGRGYEAVEACGDVVDDFHARCRRQVAIGPASAPRPSVDQATPQAKGSALVLTAPARSSAQPNTTGLMTPAPKPTTERTA